MMKTERPLWGRGIMVSPQHFQQQAAYAAWTAEVIARIGLNHPWGVVEATFEPEMLKLGRLQAHRLQVRFQDGTMIDTDNADALPSALSLDGASGEAVIVLALPLMQANGGNCLKPEEVAERPVRFRQRWRDVRNQFGDDTRQIAVMQPELTLRFAHQDNSDYPLRPMRVQDGHTEIYTVDSVISSHQQIYAPFSSFRHKGGMMRHDAAEYYYHTRVRRGPSGLYNTWLIVGGEAFDNHSVPENESLSLTLTGTNGQLPRRALQSTVLDTVMKTTSASVAVRNLCAPTLPCYPPAQDRFHWRVLSHLGSSFLSLMDNAEVLRGTLALYEWTDSEMNRRRLEAILDVNHRATERFAQGHLVRGVQIEVTLDTHGFAGRGDICLFGEMLSRFFALYTDIYLFNRLIIILQPTGERLEWEEKHSRRIPG